jgi:hypothetical protein
MEEMAAIYAWLETDASGGEGVIAAIVPGMGGIVLLQHRSRRIAELLREFAEEHHRASGHPVRLVRFNRLEVLETLP